MRIGVLGLGRMGAPIAAALAERFDVVVFDPVPERLHAVVGARTASSERGVAREAEVLVTVLPGAAEFDECARVIVDELDPGALWLDLTSNDPRIAELAATRAGARGVGFVAAPMVGGPAAAHDRSLRFTVSGEGLALARARPVLEAVAAADGIVELGPRVGDAYTVKLLGNLLWFGQAVAVSEAMLLGTSLGIDASHLLHSLAQGPGASVLLERHFPSVLDGDYLADFGIHRVVEELDTLTSLADRAGVPFELSSLVASLHREALEQFGAVDGELLVARLLERRADRDLR